MFVLAGVLAAPAQSAMAEEVVCLLPDEIAESSGLVASSTSPGVLYTHSDSGAPATYQILDADCRLTAQRRLNGRGVTNVDWEDAARGSDERGRPCLFFGDIGDNTGSRPDVAVLRVREPGPGADDGTDEASAFRLRYPDGPQDAEALIVESSGRIVIVTKSLGGISRIYATPPRPEREATLTRLGQLQFRRTGTDGGPVGVLGQVAATGAALSAGGDRVAVRTYTDVYEWPVTNGDTVAAMSEEPVVTPLPPTDQGEAVSYGADGTYLLLSSEGEGAPVHRIESALTATSSGAEAAVPNPSPSLSPSPSTASDDLRPQDLQPAVRTRFLLGVAAVVLIAAVPFLRHRYRGRRRRGR